MLSYQTATENRPPVHQMEPVIPQDIAELLNRPPILRSEDPEEYNRLEARIAVDVAPRDIIEWLLVRDIMDLIWESRRLKLMKASLIDSGIPRAARALLGPMVAHDDSARHVLEEVQAEGIVRRANGGSVDDAKRLAKYLGGSGLDQNALVAASFAMQINTIENIDQMLAKNDRRREAILRDIERRRQTIAPAFRRAAEAAITEISASR